MNQDRLCSKEVIFFVESKNCGLYLKDVIILERVIMVQVRKILDNTTFLNVCFN